jgi:ANTAR domain/GAF domain
MARSSAGEEKIMTSAPTPPARNEGRPEVTSVFDQVAVLVAGDTGVVDASRAVQLASEAVPHGEHCGITLLRPQQRPRTIAYTDEVSPAVDSLQYQLNEGPCLDAAVADAVIRVPDLAEDERWPSFAPRCVDQTGIRSMLSIRLPIGGDDRAGMNFYARTPGAFDEMDLRVGAIVATFAALAVMGELHRQDVANLQAALHSNRQIGTAVGILMATEKVTEEKAFELLRGASNQLNRKLADIAGHVNLTGALPQRPPPRG